MLNVTNLTAENQDLKNKIALVIIQLEAEGIINLDEQITVLMVNMMNFFAKYVDDIPSFDTMTQEQQDFVIKKFKKVSQDLQKKKIKSIEEMLQIFVFTVLSALAERVEYVDLTVNEIINSKSKAGFKENIRRAVEKEIYKRKNDVGNALISKKDFIYNAVLFGVVEAMNMAKLDIKYEELNKDSLKILKITHRKKHNLSL